MTRENWNKRSGRSGHWIRAAKRRAIYARDDWRCVYCGADLRSASPKERTLDHLNPRLNGKNNAARNLVTACLACNSGRGAKPWRQFAPPGAVARIERQRRRKVCAIT